MLKKKIIVGFLLSFVPIFLTSFKFDKMKKNDVNYKNIVRFAPFLFSFLHTIFMIIFEKYKIKNWYIIGATMSIIYSSIGRFLLDFPKKIFEMQNENMFHLYALIIWTIVYGLIGSFKKKMENKIVKQY